jgi:malate dehydrogenase
MPFVAILGAGELGASVARAIATRGRVPEVRLIDDASDVAAGKALDLQQAAPLERSSTQLTASGDVMAAVGAAVTIVADGAGGAPQGAELAGNAGVALVTRLTDVDRDAVILCAGATQHDVIERGLHERHLPRARLFGSAPEAMVQALRAIVAIEADASPSAVALTVLGRVPDRAVVLWSDASIAGRPLVRVLDPAQVARLERRAALLGPPGPYALAAVAARAAEMIVAGSRRIVCCTAGLDGEFGLRHGVASLPVVLGPGGIVRVVAPRLDVREQVLVENAIYDRDKATRR